MRCTVASKQLQLYIDNRLTLQQVRVLEAHLVLCRDCQRELFLLEELAGSLRELQPVVEPPNMTAQIMQRVAMTEQCNEQYSLLRPSLLELLTVILLATITTLGIIWQQPSLRAVLPFVNGHDLLSQSFLNTFNMLVAGNASALALVLWVIGTLLGVCITLVLVGDEIRAEWFKAMMDHLPVR